MKWLQPCVKGPHAGPSPNSVSPSPFDAVSISEVGACPCLCIRRRAAGGTAACSIDRAMEPDRAVLIAGLWWRRARSANEAGQPLEGRGLREAEHRRTTTRRLLLALIDLCNGPRSIGGTHGHGPENEFRPRFNRKASTAEFDVGLGAHIITGWARSKMNPRAFMCKPTAAPSRQAKHTRLTPCHTLPTPHSDRSRSSSMAFPYARRSDFELPSPSLCVVGLALVKQPQ